jgi:bacillolysin
VLNYGSGFDNAYWSGAQIVYGDAQGWPLADDVVAHELTHGVTQYESNLFYYYQSGAINESFSALWGEYYDQTNGQGNDTSDVKWLIGEDVSGLGAFRSMSNPPAYGDPDKMSSVYYYEGAVDNGGVHWNSGVNNKAVYLMGGRGHVQRKNRDSFGLGEDRCDLLRSQHQPAVIRGRLLGSVLCPTTGLHEPDRAERDHFR